MVELSVRTIILEYACPTVGTIMANIMFMAPYRDLQNAVHRGFLGELNPTPWAFMLGNCFGWVAYSILTDNLFILFANAPGFLLSIYLNSGAMKLLYHAHRSREMKKSFVEFLQVQEDLESSKRSIGDESINDKMRRRKPVDWEALVGNLTTRTSRAPSMQERLLISICVLWVSCISLISFVPTFDSETEAFIVGCVTNFNLVFFYGAPLSTLYRVCRQRDSSSIHIPTMVMNTITSSFWTAYGLAISDPFVYAPNGMGTWLGVVQVFLVCFFPRTIMIAASTQSTVSCSPTDERDSDTPTTLDGTKRLVWTTHSTGTSSVEFMYGSDDDSSVSFPLTDDHNSKSSKDPSSKIFDEQLEFDKLSNTSLIDDIDIERRNNRDDDDDESVVIEFEPDLEIGDGFFQGDDDSFESGVTYEA